ncbi:MAG: AAA family ATPase [Chloroflexi bacterium]|nr:AAA family ATPase [Chloroflexota bacterium]
MKLAITGKGGVGKTTLASMLANLYAAEGYTVLAIDADPDTNLASALGIPAEEAQAIAPISQMEDLIEERTGMRPGTSGGFFKLNPRVDDIPERFCLTRNGIKLLVLGTVKKGGGGCVCPENVLLRSLVQHLFLGRSEVVIVDMVAGIEHLGRATAQGVDALIAVVEPGMRSLGTAQAIRKLGQDIGIQRCYAVGSKVTNDSDRDFITQNLPDFTVLGFISYSPLIQQADLLGTDVFHHAPQAAAEARGIKARLESLLREESVANR